MTTETPRPEGPGPFAELYSRAGRLPLETIFAPAEPRPDPAWEARRLALIHNFAEAAYQALKDTQPDLVIGDPAAPYLRRWHLRRESDVGGIYLHEILRDDDDRALHDHPWDFHVYIAQGAYLEIRQDAPDGELFTTGDYRQIKAETLHRLVVARGPVVTLCFLGPKRREWGFQCPQGWRPWREFVDARNTGLIGRGCE